MKKQSAIFYGVSALLALIAVSFAVFANVNNESRASLEKELSAEAGAAIPTPTAHGVDGNGACREFHKDVMIEGQKVKAFGKACRKADGSWAIVRD